jgi:hypothetical protein
MQFNRLGSFWDRKGHNEIDIVAINDTEKRAVFIESKRQQKNYDKKALSDKVIYAVQKLKIQHYSIEIRGVFLDNLDTFLLDFPASPKDSL